MNAVKSGDPTLKCRRRWIAIAAATTVGVAHADIPVWQVDVYYPEGSIVSYDGHQYSAAVSQIDFRGTGWNPTSPRLWKDLGMPSGGGRFKFLDAWFSRPLAESKCALAWNPANVYTSGGVASVDGVNYRANWWTQGESPATHTSANGGQPWTMVGSCAEHSSTAADAKDRESPKMATPGSPPAVPPDASRDKS